MSLPEAEHERLLISAAVCEAGAGGLGLADAAAVVTPVDLWLVEAEHRLFVGPSSGNNLKRKAKLGNRVRYKPCRSADSWHFYYGEGGGPYTSAATHTHGHKSFITHNNFNMLYVKRNVADNATREQR